MALFSKNKYFDSFSNYLKPKTPPPPQLFDTQQSQQQPYVAQTSPLPTTKPIVPPALATKTPQTGLFFEVDGKRLYSPSGQKYDAIPAEQAPQSSGAPKTMPIGAPEVMPPKEPALTGDDFSKYYEELSGKKALETATAERDTAKVAEQTAFDKSIQQQQGLIKESQDLFSNLFEGQEYKQFTKEAQESFAKLKEIDSREASTIAALRQQNRETGKVSWAAIGSENIVRESFAGERASAATMSAIAQNNLNVATNMAERAYNSGIKTLELKANLVEQVLKRATTLSETERSEYTEVLNQARELQKQRKAEKDEAVQMFLKLSQMGIDVNPSDSIASMVSKAGPKAAQFARDEIALKKREKEADIAKKYSDIQKDKAGTIDEKKTAQAGFALEIIDRLNKNKAGKAGAVGAKIFPFTIPGTARADFNADLDGLKSLLTLENLGVMKGVLSDTDIKILTGAATTLRGSTSEAAFDAELLRVQQIFQKAAGANVSLANQVKTKGYDYPQMVADGLSDEEIKKAIGIK